MVARTYFQNNPDAPLGKVLTVGSPHAGTLKAYYLWEGGQIDKILSGPQKIAAGLVLHLRKPGFVSNAAAIQSLIPSFKDILPTFDYLKSNGQIKPLSEMKQINFWLLNLNDNLSPSFSSLINTFAGSVDASTARYLNVTEPNWLEKILGVYPDGKPVSEELYYGDNTILATSAHLANSSRTSVANLNHSELVQSQTGIGKIMEILGLSPTLISTASANLNYNQALVVQTDNAKINVTDQNNQPVGDGSSQLIILPNAPPGQYQIEIENEDKTDYHLYTGQIGEEESLWTTTAGSEDQTLEVNFNPEDPQPPNPPAGGPQITAKVLLNDLKKMINESSLSLAVKRASLTQTNGIIRLTDQKNFESAILSLYKLRQSLTVLNLKGKVDEILLNLEESYLKSKTGTYNQTKLNKELILAQALFTQSENQLKKLSPIKQKPEFGELYLKNQEKLNAAQNSLSYEAHIKALGSQSLSREALKLFR